MRRITALAAATTTAALVAAILTATPASATAPTWSAPATLTGASVATPSSPVTSVPDPAGGSMLYYSVYGVPTVQRVSATGTLGTPKSVPPYSTLGDAGSPGQIAFLANGTAIVTWVLAPYGTDYMAALSPAGAWGNVVAAAGTSVAARTGEVLTSEAGGGGITADDWTLASNGTLTHKAGPTTVFTGNPLFGQSWVALDASGSAVVATIGYTEANDNEEVYQSTRSTAGSWSAQASVSGSTGSIQNVSFAAAPGGHAIVAWQEDSSLTAPSSSAAVRVPGAGFGAAQPLSAPTSTYFAYSIPVVAAGADGSLAVGVSNEIGNGVYESTYTTQNFVWRVAPGATTVTGKATVAGTTNKFLFSSLGVGDGSVIAGIHEETLGDSPGNAAYSHSYRATETTTAVIVPASGPAVTKNFGSVSGLYDGQETCTPCDGTSPPAASVDAVSLDGKGNAVAVGQLAPGSGATSYATRSVAAPVKPAAKPTLRISSKKAKATKKVVPLTLRCTNAACKGKVALSKTIKHKSKLLASASYSIKTGTTATVRLKLTAAGKKAFKHAKKHHVKVLATATVKGGKSVAAAVTVA